MPFFSKIYASMSFLSRHLNELQRVNRPMCGAFRFIWHLDSKTYYSTRYLSPVYDQTADYAFSENFACSTEV